MKPDCDTNPAEAGAPTSKILVIEDNEDLLHLMEQILRRDYEVITAADGASGLAAVASGSPDLIVTDLMLPDFDGLELIRRLREDASTASLPIIALTARRSNEDRTEVYAAGADVYLPKPFDPDTLRACISSRLAISGRNRQSDDMQLVINLTKLNYEPADMQFLRLATEIVEKNLDKTEFDIPTFAREAGVSQTHLFRRLKELTGMSPSHFIRTIRLKAACNILERHPDIRIGELAFMVGFSDSRYFAICFKKEFGVTPSDYNDVPKTQIKK